MIDRRRVASQLGTPALLLLVTTPEYHHWHHTAEQAGLDKNFAGQLPLLDVLFGTAHVPHRWPERCGLDEPLPDGYLAQLAWPFRPAPVSPSPVRSAEATFASS